MKILSKILLVGWYIFLTVGFSVATHFCGGTVNNVKLVSVIDQSEPESCCGENSSCCSTELESIKLTDVHQIKNIDSSQSQNSLTLISSNSNQFNNNYYESFLQSKNTIPPSRSKSLLIFNCSYLI